MDDDAHVDRAANQALETRFRAARWIRPAEETPAVGAPVPARSGMPVVPHHERGFDGPQPPSGEYRDQRRSAVESGSTRTAHRARSPDGTEKAGAGLPARDGRDHRGEAAGDALRQARPGSRGARYGIRREEGRARIGHRGAEAAPRSAAGSETPRCSGRVGEAAPAARGGARRAPLAGGGGRRPAPDRGVRIARRDDPAAGTDERRGAYGKRAQSYSRGVPGA